MGFEKVMKMKICEICKKEEGKHKVKEKEAKTCIMCDTCFRVYMLFKYMTPDKGFGGTEKKMFWNEYISRFKTKKMRVGLEKLKNFVIKNNLLKMNGYEYQNSELYGKYGITLSMRAWGDFMASLMNTIEKKRKYNYINFAW